MLFAEQFFDECFAPIDGLRTLPSDTVSARARIKYVIFISILMSNDCIYYTPQIHFRNVPPRWAKSSSNPLCKWPRDYRNAKQYIRSLSFYGRHLWIRLVTMLTITFFFTYDLCRVFERFVCDAVRALSYLKFFIIPKIINIDKTSIFAHCGLPWFLHLRLVSTVYVSL